MLALSRSSWQTIRNFTLWVLTSGVRTPQLWSAQETSHTKFGEIKSNELKVEVRGVPKTHTARVTHPVNTLYTASPVQIPRLHCELCPQILNPKPLILKPEPQTLIPDP